MIKNKDIHILFLSSWFPSKVSPWAGDFVQRHAKAVSTLHKVTVVFAIASFAERKIQENIFEEGNYKEIVIVFPKSKFRILNGIIKWKLCLQHIARLPKFDLIHVNVTFPIGLLALFLKKIKNHPYVITEHWTGYLPQDPVKINWLQRLFTRKVLENASYLLPVSESLGKALLNLSKNKNVKVIRNVVDEKIFKFLPERKKEKFTFLHISNLSYQKNVKGMLSVAHRLWKEGYDFILEIGGNGDLNPVIEFQKKYDLQGRISIFGSLTQNQVAEKMQEADCFLLFSRFENQPCVQNESFFTGLPVIATDVGGISELFPEGFGELIEPENEKQLYEAMKNALTNDYLAEKEKIHAFAKENFSIPEIAKQFSSVYHQILSGR